MPHIRTSLVVLATVFVVACSGGSPAAPTAPTPAAAATPTSTTPAPSGPQSTTCRPAAPVNFTVSLVGGNRTFNWSAVPNAVDYFILIGNASGLSDIVNTNTTQTTYLWNGAPIGTYYARVYARNSCGSGPNSNEISFN